MNPKILVVQDSENVIELLEYILKREGFMVKSIMDGLTLSAMIQADEAPGLVILDISLPYKDGYQLMQEIRANTNWKDVPVMILSSKSTEQDIVKAFENGA